jgi:hypothetical protein
VLTIRSLSTSERVIILVNDSQRPRSHCRADNWVSSLLLSCERSGYGTNSGVVKSGYVLRCPFRLRGQVADVRAWAWAWVVKTVRRRSVKVDSPAAEHCAADVFNLRLCSCSGRYGSQQCSDGVRMQSPHVDSVDADRTSLAR